MVKTLILNSSNVVPNSDNGVLALLSRGNHTAMRCDIETANRC